MRDARLYRNCNVTVFQTVMASCRTSLLLDTGIRKQEDPGAICGFTYVSSPSFFSSPLPFSFLLSCLSPPSAQQTGNDPSYAKHFCIVFLLFFLHEERSGFVTSPDPTPNPCTSTPVPPNLHPTNTYTLCSAPMQKVQKRLTCLNSLKFMLLMKTQGLFRPTFLKAPGPSKRTS